MKKREKQEEKMQVIAALSSAGPRNNLISRETTRHNRRKDLRKESITTSSESLCMILKDVKNIRCDTLSHPKERMTDQFRKRVIKNSTDNMKQNHRKISQLFSINDVDREFSIESHRSTLKKLRNSSHTQSSSKSSFNFKLEMMGNYFNFIIVLLIFMNALCIESSRHLLKPVVYNKSRLNHSNNNTSPLIELTNDKMANLFSLVSGSKFVHGSYSRQKLSPVNKHVIKSSQDDATIARTSANKAPQESLTGKNYRKSCKKGPCVEDMKTKVRRALTYEISRSLDSDITGSSTSTPLYATIENTNIMSWFRNFFRDTQKHFSGTLGDDSKNTLTKNGRRSNSSNRVSRSIRNKLKRSSSDVTIDDVKEDDFEKIVEIVTNLIMGAMQYLGYFKNTPDKLQSRFGAPFIAYDYNDEYQMLRNSISRYDYISKYEKQDYDTSSYGYKESKSNFVDQSKRPTHLQRLDFEDFEEGRQFFGLGVITGTAINFLRNPVVLFLFFWLNVWISYTIINYFFTSETFLGGGITGFFLGLGGGGTTAQSGTIQPPAVNNPVTIATVLDSISSPPPIVDTFVTPKPPTTSASTSTSSTSSTTKTPSATPSPPTVTPSSSSTTVSIGGDPSLPTINVVDSSTDFSITQVPTTTPVTPVTGSSPIQPVSDGPLTLPPDILAFLNETLSLINSTLEPDTDMPVIDITGDGSLTTKKPVEITVSSTTTEKSTLKPIFGSVTEGVTTTKDPFGFVTTKRPPITKPHGFFSSTTKDPFAFLTTAPTIFTSTSKDPSGTTKDPFGFVTTKRPPITKPPGFFSTTTKDPFGFVTTKRPPVTKPPGFFSTTTKDPFGFVTTKKPLNTKPPGLFTTTTKDPFLTTAPTIFTSTSKDPFGTTKDPFGFVTTKRPPITKPPGFFSTTTKDPFTFLTTSKPTSTAPTVSSSITTKDPLGFVTKPRPPIGRPPSFFTTTTNDPFYLNTKPQTTEMTPLTASSSEETMISTTPSVVTGTMEGNTDTSSETSENTETDGTTFNPLGFVTKPRPIITKPPGYYSSTKSTPFDNLAYVTKPRPIITKPPEFFSSQSTNNIDHPDSTILPEISTTDSYNTESILTDEDLITMFVKMTESTLGLEVFNDSLIENSTVLPQTIYDNIIDILSSYITSTTSDEFGSETFSTTSNYDSTHFDSTTLQDTSHDQNTQFESPKPSVSDTYEYITKPIKPFGTDPPTFVNTNTQPSVVDTFDPLAYYTKPRPVFTKPPNFYRPEYVSPDEEPMPIRPLNVLDKCLSEGGNLNKCLQESSLYGQLFVDTSGYPSTTKSPSHSSGIPVDPYSSFIKDFLNYTSFEYTGKTNTVSANAATTEPYEEYFEQNMSFLVNSSNKVDDQEKLTNLAHQLLVNHTAIHTKLPYGYTTKYQPDINMGKSSESISPFYTVTTQDPEIDTESAKGYGSEVTFSDSENKIPSDEDSGTKISLTEESETAIPANDDSRTKIPSDEDSEKKFPSTEESKTTIQSNEDSETKIPLSEEPETKIPSTEDSDTSPKVDSTTSTATPHFSPFLQMMLKKHPHANIIAGPPPKYLTTKKKFKGRI